MRIILDGRDAYIAAHGLDPDVFLPGNLWRDEFRDVNFENLASKDRRKLNLLRFFAWTFSGYQFLEWDREKNKPFKDLPADLDQQIQARFAMIPTEFLTYPVQTENFTKEPMVQAPNRFGECGVVMNGRVLNFDTWTTFYQLNALLNAGVLELLGDRQQAGRRTTVVEIGSGYGNTAHEMTRFFQTMRYVCVDLPESLIYAAIYLSVLRGARAPEILDPIDPGFAPSPDSMLQFLPNFAFTQFKGAVGSVDLAMNFRSLPEMAAEQVRFYGQEIASMLAEDGLFFEQNFYLADRHADVETIFREIFNYCLVVPERARSHMIRGKARLWAMNDVALPAPLKLQPC